MLYRLNVVCYCIESKYNVYLKHETSHIFG